MERKLLQIAFASQTRRALLRQVARQAQPGAVT
ncbi:hypothetical protein SAMN05443247_09239 [Bradyrhizobium erythrophlei]|nr:hypothetical protein SAMN05443247_09239 [Bradyrhizobium erythrophlei]